MTMSILGLFTLGVVEKEPQNVKTCIFNFNFTGETPVILAYLIFQL